MVIDHSLRAISMINLWLDFLAADLSFYFESKADNLCPEWGVTQFDFLP